MSDRADAGRLPPLLVGDRRPLAARLVVASVARSAAALTTALLVGALVGAAPGEAPRLGVALAIALAGTGAATYAERVLAERLGQEYVHDLRGRLVSGALHDDDGPSLGVTVARTTNDLAAVRTWVAQGLAPLVAAVPLGLGAVAVLGWLHWSLALAAVVPLVVLAAVLALVAPRAYSRARRLRRLRGRLAGRVTDTLLARDGIRVAGGERRELRRLEEGSRDVVGAAVARARTAGVLQAAALTAAGAIAVLVAVAGRTTGLDAGALATALTVAGVVGATLGETGRVAEYRQNLRAAAHVLGPRVADRPTPAPVREQRRVPGGRGLLRATGLDDAGSTLSARAGHRVHLVGPTPDRAAEALRRLASGGDHAHVVVDGLDLARLPPDERRRLVGVASPAMPLERGTVARAVRYRRPDLARAEATDALDRVGLSEVVATLPRRERTELRRGGEPLTRSQVALLQLARATLGGPPLLLLDRVDAELDETGREALRSLVATYPGVVVFTSEQPERVCPDARRVCLG